MFVIGVAGQAQMGKDTLADRLAEKLNESGANWKRTAFAKNVKRVYAETFDVDYDFIEKWKTEPEPPPGFDMTVRKSLQFIGDGFRGIKSTIWVDLCFRDQSPQIISDVRYPNEFLRVAKEGGMNILVGRSEKVNSDPNGSEALIRPYVQWALDNTEGAFVEVDKVVEANRNRFFDCPEFFPMFDVFIRNDGTKEELYELIDTQLVPYVQKFVFDFETEEEGKPCHTLS